MVRRWLALCLIVFVAGSAMAERRRAVKPPSPPKSSETLIQDALQNGAIDSETALLYRVYTVFGDDRLPAVYRGATRMSLTAWSCSRCASVSLRFRLRRNRFSLRT